MELELTCSTSMTLSRPIEWGIIGNHLSVESDAHPERRLGLINHEVDSASPTMRDSSIVEFQLFESEPGLCPVEIAITCSTYGGRATYVYTYVWQD